MTDTELILALKENEFGSFLLLRDDEGHEYQITGVSMTMGGCFHQVLELSRIPAADNFFRTLQQSIDGCKKRIEEYKNPEWQKGIRETCGEEFLESFLEREISGLENCIKVYEEKQRSKGNV